MCPKLNLTLNNHGTTIQWASKDTSIQPFAHARYMNSCRNAYTSACIHESSSKELSTTAAGRNEHGLDKVCLKIPSRRLASTSILCKSSMLASYALFLGAWELDGYKHLVGPLCPYHLRMQFNVNRHHSACCWTLERSGAPRCKGSRNKNSIAVQTTW